jgi:drug/metabolite transporter (DMT)-like permease
MPVVFVLIWSTGFVVARFGMPHAPPLTFLSWRYSLSILAFLIWIAYSRPPWPKDKAAWFHLAISGVLMHAGYLGGVWAAVKAGIPAGTVAIIVGLQPLLTSAWLARDVQAPSALAPRHWLGLLLGFCGLAMVVWPKLHTGEVTPMNLALSVLALASITVGTLYQKKHVVAQDVRTANTVQLLAALVVSLPFAAIETEGMHWHPELVGALAWSVLGLTLGGSSLLYLLIQRGAAARVSSLMYLVPPCTALLAAWFFGEPLTLAMGAGMLLAAGGVALVLRVAAAGPPTRIAHPVE